MRPPERNSRRQQDAFDRFQHAGRPHAGQLLSAVATLDAAPHAGVDYVDDVVVRRISQQGSLKMRGARTFISEIFAHGWLGLRALDERYFDGPVRLGFLDTREQLFAPCTARCGVGSGWKSPWK